MPGGGSLYQSVLLSAEEYDGKLIGVDADQSGISERFLTSATKGIDASVIVALDEFFASGKKWPDKLGGQAVSYGAKEKCVSLPGAGNCMAFPDCHDKRVFAAAYPIEIRRYPDSD